MKECIRDHTYYQEKERSQIAEYFTGMRPTDIEQFFSSRGINVPFKYYVNRDMITYRVFDVDLT